LYPRWEVTTQQLMAWKEQFGMCNQEWLQEACTLMYRQWTGENPKPKWLAESFRQVRAGHQGIPLDESCAAAEHTQKEKQEWEQHVLQCDLDRSRNWKTMQDMGFTLVEQAKLPVLYSREKLEEYINSRKIEGLVLKLRTLAGWYKLKPVLTADCIVTDYFYGEGKYTGMMGALEASVYDEHGTLIPVAHVGGGWKDVDRMVKHADVMGRVMEVKYDCILKNRLRFPRFYRWRDDKPANECLLPERGR